MARQKVVLDTNVFVAAGFNPNSASARIIEKIEQGELQMVWTEGTLEETRHIVSQIPPLSWEPFEGLFREEAQYQEPIHPEQFESVPDPADRKFAALAQAADAVLVSQDDDLLGHQSQVDVPIVHPGEFLSRLSD